MVDRVTVSGDPGLEVTLGWRELGQRPGSLSAEERHLQLRRGESGWTIRNLATERRVLLHYSDYGELFLRRWDLRFGDRIQLGGRSFEVVELIPDQLLELYSDGVRYRIHHERGSDARLEDSGTSNWLAGEACGVAGGGVREVLVGLKHRFGGGERTLVWLGGGVDCADRISAGAAAPRTLRVVYRKGTLFIAPGEGSGEGARFRRSGGREMTFSDVARPLFPRRGPGLHGQLGRLEYLIVGRAHYLVGGDDEGRVSLTPVRNRHRFFDLRSALTPPGFSDEEASLVEAAWLEDVARTLPDGVSLDLLNLARDRDRDRIRIRDGFAGLEYSFPGQDAQVRRRWLLTAPLIVALPSWGAHGRSI